MERTGRHTLACPFCDAPAPKGSARGRATREARAAAKIARQLEAARAMAAESPRDVSRAISKTLGRYSSLERGVRILAESGREYNRAAKAAKARGWTQMAATLRAHHNRIRAAIRDAENRHAFALANRPTARAIARYRRDVRDLESGQLSIGYRSCDGVCPIEDAFTMAQALQRVARAASQLCDDRRIPESVKAELRNVWARADTRAAEYESRANAERLCDAIDESATV